ncbi:M15 family metallopeptidase [Bacteroides sp.]|uniref:M15 family metallopeptidase n=1 Tax=Bacteroides sp. TaxID=29523 RepID=UPI0026018856|nr:M15 family metallopeptidase [Bacteroides sp.]MDD3040082.1 M15 family metallopeptidase [Bacteroides sp.]
MSDITKACRDISELSVSAQAACTLFLDKCKKAGLSVLITETYRPQARQNWLYEQGRTRPGNVVTWTRNSRHTGRMAWDICKHVKGQEYSDNSFFVKCGSIAKELGITWGGTWETPDKPHFEISSTWKEPKKEDDEMITKELVIINKNEYAMDAIRKDGNVYVKVRDLMMAPGIEVKSRGRIPVIETK